MVKPSFARLGNSHNIAVARVSHQHFIEKGISYNFCSKLSLKLLYIIGIIDFEV